MAYGYFKDLHKKAAYDKVLHDKIFKIAENPRDHASMAYKFFDKKSAGTSSHTETGTKFENHQLEEELHKAIISKFKKHKVWPPFKNNIKGVDLADMQLISKYSKVYLILFMCY